MRRLRVPALLVAVSCGLAISPIVSAQEPAAKETAAKEERAEPSIFWNIANFLILAGILGYFIKKNAGPYFATRSKQIQAAMNDAAEAQREAEARVAEMEKRIAGLGAEIDKMRTAMRHEMAAEGERIRLETEHHIKRIEEQAQQEIESVTKSARRELKLYSAELALKSAEEQLKTRVNKEVEDRLVSSFIADLRDGAPRSTNN